MTRTRDLSSLIAGPFWRFTGRIFFREEPESSDAAYDRGYSDGERDGIRLWKLSEERRPGGPHPGHYREFIAELDRFLGP